MKKYFPTDRYRKRDGVFQVATFAAAPIPDGWFDTPALCEGYVHNVTPLVRVPAEVVQREIERAICAEAMAMAAAAASEYNAKTDAETRGSDFTGMVEPDRPRRGRPRKA